MTKQEEIRSVLGAVLTNILNDWGILGIDKLVAGLVDQILKYEDSLGIKLPNGESLIKEEPIEIGCH